MSLLLRQKPPDLSHRWLSYALSLNPSGLWLLRDAGLLDSSGNGSHLTASASAPTAAQGPNGSLPRAAQFASASSQLAFVNDNALISTGDITFSLAAWVTLTSEPAAIMAVLGKWATGQFEYLIYWDNTTQKFIFTVSSTGLNAISVTATSMAATVPGTWYFIGACHNATANTLSIQINNGTVDSQAHALGVRDGSGRLEIGHYQDGGAAGFLNGAVAGVALYKKLLSAGEWSRLYGLGL